MTPYTLNEHFVTGEQLGMFKYIRHVLEQAPDITWGIHIPSCHHVCHALASVFPIVRVNDGYFGKGEPHSWLEFEPSLHATRADRRARVIADMYPIAGVTPFLVYTFFMTTWAKLYIPDVYVLSNVMRENPLFNDQVKELATCFRTLKPQ